MNTATIQVRWRGQQLALEVCYSAERVAEILERWPDRVIELARIFEHESPSSAAARAFIVRRALAVAGEPIPDVMAEGVPRSTLANASQVRRYLASLDEGAKPLSAAEAAELMSQVTGSSAAPVRTPFATGAFGFRSRS